MILLKEFRDELKVNTTGSASSISFGPSARDGINGTLVTLAIASGMTSATNPSRGTPGAG
jgi:cobalamin-dependent methionine synthase I